MDLKFLENKVVLITGGTGSFGQQCVKTLLNKSRISKIIVFSRDELKQLQMQNSIPDPENCLRFFIGDVRDLERLERSFNGVNYVIHAAALKQVPALEYNPFEAIKTNILGTKNVIDAAIDQGVEKVLFLSTDKAASPANLYGATKLCAEKLVVAGNAYAGNKTRLGVVRYGNVLGSRGSLIKIIEEQRKGGEVTLTHEEMTRFWISLQQGVNFVLMVLEKMQGGEIFIPKMPSMKIIDMIKIMAPGCTIKKIGIRPGEKLHEALITIEEARHTKEYDDYYMILPEYSWWSADRYNDGGRHLENDFFLSSYSTECKLDVDGLKKLIESI